MSTDPRSDDKPGNRLIRETSPYLRQHAHNPVDWYPWGDEAIEKARELDRAIFLSVGYSSCHWCHVMERESFENPAIAEIMNEHFINVKVDREERPDIDALYMNAVQLLTRQGGWPMSVFLDADLRPFWGGTYFPPESRMGHPGFPDILRSVAQAYRERRDEIAETAQTLVQHLKDESYRSDDLPGRDEIDKAVADASKSFDSNFGGFGAAPKFPRSIDLDLLLREHRRSGEEEVRTMVDRTLHGMALGGMYDQIGGGFHRYSTDVRWLVPHFEKMLYDNALLARTYTFAFQANGGDLYSAVAREVLDYVIREMTSPEGGFYSATDADSEGEEGVFFVWTPSQVEAVVGVDDAQLVCAYYNITERGNFEKRTSIPHVTRNASDVAKECGVDVAEFSRRVGDAREALYRAREKREKPFRDDKTLSAWNGLMISAFARGAQVYGDSRYEEAARGAADLLLDKLHDGDRLLRVRNEGESKIAAFLDDYAYVAEGLIDLYEASFEIRYLREARRLMDFVVASFRDAGTGNFFFAAADSEELIVRRSDPFDSATPAGGGVAALNLLRLAQIFGEDSYRSVVEEYFRSIRTVIPKAPRAFGSTLLALDAYLEGFTEIVIVGEADSRRDLIAAAHASYLPSRVLLAVTRDEVSSLASELPLLEGRGGGNGATAFVCRHGACSAPIATPEGLREELAKR